MERRRKEKVGYGKEKYKTKIVPAHRRPMDQIRMGKAQVERKRKK